MNTAIIISGAQGAGKSNLAQALLELARGEHKVTNIKVSQRCMALMIIGHGVLLIEEARSLEEIREFEQELRELQISVEKKDLTTIYCITQEITSKVEGFIIINLAAVNG